jgi:hypothetical protein
MKKLVLVAGLLLVAAFVQPYIARVVSKPVVVADDPVPTTNEVDSKISSILKAASQADRNRIVGVYKALKSTLIKDNGKRVVTTEQWRDLHGNTLDLAIETPGKYSGLDLAIEAVFFRTVGTDDVLPGNDATRAKLINACDIIVNSAR